MGTPRSRARLAARGPRAVLQLAVPRRGRDRHALEPRGRARGAAARRRAAGFDSYAAWEAWVERLVLLGVMADYTRLWWDARPAATVRHARDPHRRPDDVARTDGAARTRIRDLVADAPTRVTPRGDYLQNRWAAARAASRRELIHPDGTRLVGVAGAARLRAAFARGDATDATHPQLVAEDADRSLTWPCSPTRPGQRHSLRALRNRLAAALTGHEGLEQANANLMGQVMLAWDDETSRDDLLAKMASAGFRELSVLFCVVLAGLGIAPAARAGGRGLVVLAFARTGPCCSGAPVRSDRRRSSRQRDCSCGSFTRSRGNHTTPADVVCTVAVMAEDATRIATRRAIGCASRRKRSRSPTRCTVSRGTSRLERGRGGARAGDVRARVPQLAVVHAGDESARLAAADPHEPQHRPRARARSVRRRRRRSRRTTTTCTTSSQRRRGRAAGRRGACGRAVVAGRHRRPRSRPCPMISVT